MSDFERIITFRPAYDKRSDIPSKNYGVHGVNLTFILKGELGAIQFVIYTNWHLPHIEKINDTYLNSEFPHLHCHPQPADLGYHSPKPMYDGQEQMGDDCKYVIGGKCYYDGSGLQARKVYDILVAEGSDAVWKRLEEEYNYRFIEKIS